jgi:hypothetical protein
VPPNVSYLKIVCANVSNGAPVSTGSSWSSPVNEIAKLHARKLTLKLQTHLICLGQFGETRSQMLLSLDDQQPTMGTIAA